MMLKVFSLCQQRKLHWVTKGIGEMECGAEEGGDPQA